MTILFLILIIIASVVLGLIVLIQNPKGGGLASSFGGLSTQFMGVKQTNDVLEKGTWVFGSIIGILCLLSAFFIDRNASEEGMPSNNAAGAPAPPSTSAPAPQSAFPVTPGANSAPFDSGR